MFRGWQTATMLNLPVSCSGLVRMPDHRSQENRGARGQPPRLVSAVESGRVKQEYPCSATVYRSEWTGRSRQLPRSQFVTWPPGREWTECRLGKPLPEKNSTIVAPPSRSWGGDYNFLRGTTFAAVLAASVKSSSLSSRASVLRSPRSRAAEETSPK